MVKIKEDIVILPVKNGKHDVLIELTEEDITNALKIFEEFRNRRRYLDGIGIGLIFHHHFGDKHIPVFRYRKISGEEKIILRITQEQLFELEQIGHFAKGFVTIKGKIKDIKW